MTTKNARAKVLQTTKARGGVLLGLKKGVVCI
jgi:hypothetical protein